MRQSIIVVRKKIWIASKVAMIFKYQPGKFGVILFTAKPPVFGENSQFGEPLAPKIFGLS